jgi:hypothetical protein
MRVAALAMLWWMLGTAGAAENTLIPSALNSALARIQPGMKVSIAESLLRLYYPMMRAGVGDWSGGGGYAVYLLDDRHSISIACLERNGNRFVHESLLFYLHDHETKQKVEIRVGKWGNHQDPT